MSTKISCEDRRPLNLRMDGVLQGSENNVGFHELQRKKLDLPPIQQQKTKTKVRRKGLILLVDLGLSRAVFC